MKPPGNNLAIGLSLLCLWVSLTGLASLDEQLFLWTGAGNVDEVKRLIEAGAAVDAPDKDG